MALDHKRIDWIDYTKGIGIILTIVGHTVRQGLLGGAARALIFSFHMPLFFMLSSLTYNYVEDVDVFRNKTKKSARHLLMPVVSVTMIYIFWRVIHEPSLVISLPYWKAVIYQIIIGSGVDEYIGNYKVNALGIPWFFFALFIGRTAYHYIRIKQHDMFIISTMITLIGISLGRNDGYLPFSMDIALAVFLFLWVGDKMKTTYPEQASLSLAGLSFVIWIFTLAFLVPNKQWTYLELAVRRYSLFPISYICAITGTFLFCEIGKYISKMGGIFVPLKIIGKYSLDLLLIHHLDSMWFALWAVEGRQFFTSAKRVAVDLTLFAIVRIIKMLIYIMKRRSRRNEI